MYMGPLISDDCSTSKISKYQTAIIPSGDILHVLEELQLQLYKYDYYNYYV